MPDSDNRVLILFAHPSPDRSEVNVPLFAASRSKEEVTIVDLYAEYPDGRIDIELEQQRLREHATVVFMFPLYWYSTPAILKEWQDLVLEYGFAYGLNGTALHGKTFLCVVSAGGASTAYQPDGFNQFTLRELLQPLEQTAALTGMAYLPPFVLFGSRTAVEEQRLDSHVAAWEALLGLLIDGRLDVARASDFQTLNDALAPVTGAQL